MTVQTTPGPWTADLSEDRDGRIHVNAGTYAVALVSCRIGHGVHDGNQQQLANARLIAEAPAMRETIERMTEALRVANHMYHEATDNIEEYAMPEWEKEIAKARALLARIEGK